MGTRKRVAAMIVGKCSLKDCSDVVTNLQNGKAVNPRTLACCFLKTYQTMQSHRRRISELQDRIRFLMGKTADFRQ